MHVLIFAILLTSVYNAAAAAMGWKLRWTVALYWCWVAAYWLMKAGG